MSKVVGTEGEGLLQDEQYGVEKYFARYSKEEIENLLSNSFDFVNWIFPKTNSYDTNPWIVTLAKRRS